MWWQVSFDQLFCCYFLNIFTYKVVFGCWWQRRPGWQCPSYVLWTASRATCYWRLIWATGNPGILSPSLCPSAGPPNVCLRCLLCMAGIPGARLQPTDIPHTLPHLRVVACRYGMVSDPSRPPAAAHQRLVQVSYSLGPGVLCCGGHGQARAGPDSAPWCPQHPGISLLIVRPRILTNKCY